MPSRRFAYAYINKDRTQRLNLAEIFDDPFLPFARDLREMNRIPGSRETFGIPEEFNLLVASRDNRYVAALSIQSGQDFVDYNVKIYSMQTGHMTLSCNEHSFGDTNRSNCTAPNFDYFLAQQRDAGASENQLAEYDYMLMVDNLFVQITNLAWTAESTLLLSLQTDIVAVGPNIPFADLGYHTFHFEIGPGQGEGNPYILRRQTTPFPETPSPPKQFDLSKSVAKRLKNTIRYRSKSVAFPDRGRRPSRTQVRRALLVAGYP